MKANRYVKRYQKMVKSAIPKDYPHRAKILGDMQDILEVYMEEHPQADYEELSREFGAPEELAASLVDSLSSEEVLRLFQCRKRWGIATIVIAIVAAFIVTVALINLAERNRAVEIKETITIYEDEAVVSNDL